MRNAGQISHGAFRLPLLPKKEDLSCLGSNERNPPEAEAREGRVSGSERVIGVRIPRNQLRALNP
jgi:hypothetical protein